MLICTESINTTVHANFRWGCARTQKQYVNERMLVHLSVDILGDRLPVTKTLDSEAHTDLLHTLTTIRDYLRYACSRFREANIFCGHGTDNPWDEAVQLIMPTLYLPWDCPSDLASAVLTMEERSKVIAAVERRIKERIPAAYITGRAWFAGLEFIVDEQVLVPRSPISELIASEFDPWLDHYPHQILDLCTGSGCIGIACATTFAESSVVLSDIDEGALSVARSNVELHQLQDQVEVVQSDLFKGLKGRRFDLIVSNPPYVNAEDLAAMPQEFRAEPEIALGSGEDGLDFTRQLLRQVRDYLTDEGVLVVEVGNSWPALEAAYPNVPFTWLEFEQGGHGVFVLSAQQFDEHAEVFRLQ